MSAEHRRWPLATYWADVAWAAFSLVNLGVMIAIPGWETIPFHFIWVSLTLLYGFRVWGLGRTWLVLAVVMVATGAPIAADAASGTQPLGEIAEVPLMTAMFVVMVWHARRRAAALEEVERVSETNARLLERERRFLQDASHELRTPITVAMGHAELILRAATDAAVAEDARVVVDEMGRLRWLAERLLLLASAEQPSFLRPRLLSPGTMIDAAMRRWAHIPRTWAVVRGPAPEINGDADRLAAALDALIENAVTYTGDDDRIELRLRQEGGDAVISVADEGTGIAPEHLESIFGRFARSDPSRNRGGVGLGLNIAKTIAEAHGGTLRVTSTLGKGTVFELVLPAATNGQQSPPVVIPVPLAADTVGSR
ncbi:MAG: two-component system, OmpR family, sensor kinase [Actinomycetota bacterium]|nr:two-component system, OmpR family, sensor kinase [Actinomycetota bacterium]